MPRTVKGKPLEKVCLGLAFRDICRGHCDIMVVHSQYMDGVFYLTSLESSLHVVPILIGLYGVTTSPPMFLKVSPRQNFNKDFPYVAVTQG